MLKNRIRTAALVSLLCIAPPVANAQGTASLWDLIKPEFLIQRAAQSGIMALRTQLDLTYQSMDVDIGLSKVTLTGIEAWPVVAWDNSGPCEVGIDQITIRLAPLDQPELVRLNVQALGVNVASNCLPPAQVQGLSMAGLENIAVPLLNIDLAYDIAQASADLGAHARLDGFATLDLTADFSYLWFDGRQDMDNPEPVAFLRAASLKLENLGGFEALSPMLPPPFLDAAQSPLILEGMISGKLVEMNRGAKLSPAQTAFLDSIKTAWPLFLGDPSALVLETNIADGDQIFLNFEDYGRNPGQAFQDLRPALSLSLAATRNALPVALIRQVLDGDTDTLTPEVLRQVGLALTMGQGAPRNLSAGIAVLGGLATAGDAEAALALAAALEVSDPAAAYSWALRAGANGQTRAGAALNRLENTLPMSEVLAAQHELASGISLAQDTLSNIASIRSAAMSLFTGSGQPRSYVEANYWALLGAAAGDGVSEGILDQIAEKMQGADASGLQAWRDVEVQSSARAMQVWLDEDLPARLSGQ